MKRLFSIALASLCLLCSTLSAQTVGLITHLPGSTDDGYVLFAPLNSLNTYLIDKCGRQVHSWNSTYSPGQAVYLLGDGILLHTGNYNNPNFTGGGRGGIIEKLDWDSKVLWSYVVSDANQCQHHDAKQLPNGNVLAIIWERKTKVEAVAWGRNPNLASGTIWTEKIIELHPTGAATAEIVWQWNVWDHIVQNFDSTKPNFAKVSDHSELINLNFGANLQSDWLHCNSVDYNSTLDEIMISSHNINEIWIIDHSTTTAEAAGHSGGKKGKGGDLLYRWGNPAAYEHGALSNQRLWGQHNAHWIESGLPFAGNIMIFDNGHGIQGPTNYSSIEIITPPRSEKGAYDTALPFGPLASTWSYQDPNPQNFYAMNISGAQQLSNGNVLICNGPSGEFFEIDANKKTVWRYINPVSQSGIASQGSTAMMNLVFRCAFYPFSYTGLAGHILSPGVPIELNPLPVNCTLAGVSEDTPLKDEFRVSPNPSSSTITISGNTQNNGTAEIRVINTLGEVVRSSIDPNIAETFSLDISGLPKGAYIVLIITSKAQFTEKILVQ